MFLLLQWCFPEAFAKLRFDIGPCPVETNCAPAGEGVAAPAIAEKKVTKSSTKADDK